MNVYIKITSDCNLKCKHCFSKNTKQNIDINIIDAFISNNLDQLYNSTIILHGGEPLLYPKDKLSALIKLIKGYKLSIQITSNLSIHLNDDMKELLSEFDYIKTSFDFHRFQSISEIYRWIHSIKLLSKRIPIGLNITATKQMILIDIHRWFHLASKLNIYEIDISPLFTAHLKSNDIIPDYDEFLSWLIQYYKISKQYSIQNALAYKMEHPMEFYNQDCCNNNITINEDGSVSICPTDTKGTFLSERADSYIIQNKRPLLIHDKCMQCDELNTCCSSCHSLRLGNSNVCKAYFKAISMIGMI